MDFSPWGVVYIIRCKKLHKIGYTWGWVEDRVRTLQAGNPDKLWLVCAIPVVDPIGTERELHRMFRHCHVRGEWFRLDNRDIANFRAEAQRARQEYARWKSEINYQV